MWMILVAIIVATVISGFLMFKGDDEFSTLFLLSGLLLACGAGLAAVVFAIQGWGYIGAMHKANIINREYNTNYTQAEVFYASGVIDTIRQLNRQRIELQREHHVE